MDIQFDDLDNLFETTLDADLTASATTVYLVDVPTNTTEGFLAIDADDKTKIEFIHFNAKGAGFVSVPASGGRGQGGTTAVEHSAGAVVKMYVMREHIKSLRDGILAEHEQNGTHKKSALDEMDYAPDAGGDDAYEITLSPIPAAYYAGMEINFKPTTANTGACTLNVNSLGAKTIKKNTATDLSTGDIIANQITKVIYDGTNFQLVSAFTPAMIGCGVRNSAAQSMTHNAFTKLAFDAEDWDNDAMHDTGSNTSRITCKTAGKYLLTISCQTAGSAGGLQRRLDFILNNGTTYGAAMPAISGGNNLSFSGSVMLDLAVNDYVEAQFFQDSGAGLNMTSQKFAAVRIGA